jgi:hypothetical protein
VEYHASARVVVELESFVADSGQRGVGIEPDPGVVNEVVGTGICTPPAAGPLATLLSAATARPAVIGESTE